MEKHPEGGYYRRLYLQTESFASSIYYLLPAGEKSCFHSMRSDELLLFHQGATLQVLVIQETGELKSYKLGNNILVGEQPQLKIKAGQIFGMQMLSEGEYSLISCVVTPAFTFEQFKLYTQAELMECYPKLAKSTLKEFCFA